MSSVSSVYSNSLWLNFHGCSKCFRTDVGKAELDTLAERSRAKWENMSTKDKVADFAARHQFSLIGTSWAASMIGAYAWISRDPYELLCLTIRYGSNICICLWLALPRLYRRWEWYCTLMLCTSWFTSFSHRSRRRVCGLVYAFFTHSGLQPCSLGLQAQGLTLGIIISAAVLTHGRVRKDVADHSWRDVLEQEGELAPQGSEQNPKRPS